MDGKRYLVVTADDYGIGPATSQGILDLAARKLVTGAVLLVNSPYAEASIQQWKRSGVPLELGWHPCLTLDKPILPPGRVPSLIGPDGRFHPLGTFLRRLMGRSIRPDEIAAELQAQQDRFRELVGHPPSVVNAHHHVHIFPPVGRILLDVLRRSWPLPYLRRVQEPWTVLRAVPGARLKRAFLSLLGRRAARRQQKQGFPGNDWLAGITDPGCVSDPEFLWRWLVHVPGRVVELTCHPGYFDTTVAGRDGSPEDGQLHRRVHEMQLLKGQRFRDACSQAGFQLVPPSALAESSQLAPRVATTNSRSELTTRAGVAGGARAA